MAYTRWRSFNLADELITRLNVEQVEGGIIVAGRPFHSNQCPILTLVFSACFLSIGIILTVLAYRPVPLHLSIYLRHFSSSHIAGPFLLVMGCIFLTVGFTMYIVMERLKPEQEDPEQVMERDGQRARRKRYLPWITTPPSRFSTSKAKWMSPCRGSSFFKRNQVIQDLLHNSNTTEFICNSMNNSISDFNCLGDIASFPPSYQSSVSSNTCLAV